jgi:hypothetical protein
MAGLATTNPTIVDVAKATDPDGSIATVVEMLNQTNDILDHATWIECNNGTSHRTSIRSGIPAPTWRRLYQGVQPTKSTRVQVEDNTGMLAQYAEIDVDLANMNGNAPAFRLSEDAAFIEGMNQEFASTLFYGNEGTAPAEFTGLAPRFNSLSAANGYNIIDAGGNDTDLTSMWLIVWGPRTAHCLYPKGFKAGLDMKDLGEDTLEDADGNNGGRMQVYRTYYTWKCGFSVRDWRYIVRIANIDVSALHKNPNGSGGTGADLLDLMIGALERVPNINAGRPAFYCSRTVREFLRKQERSAVANSTLSMENIAGKKFVTFDGVPVGRTDAILHTESRVT